MILISFSRQKKRLTLESFCIGCTGRKTRRLLCSKAERERQRFMTEEIVDPFYATRHASLLRQFQVSNVQ